MMLCSLLLAAPLCLVQDPPAPAPDWRAWVAALAPSYVREDGQRADPQVVQPLMEFLCSEDAASAEGADFERARMEAFERLCPHLRAEHLVWLEEGLLNGSLAAPDTARAMLLAARVSESGPSLRRLALAEGASLAFRSEAAARLLAAEGRAALDALDPLLESDTDPALLRRIYAAWGGMVEEDDLPRLEALVQAGAGLVSEFALQTWARAETRDEKRVEILRLSEGSTSAFRGIILRELAAQGPSPALVIHLLSLFESPHSEDRRLALQYLASFAPPEQVFAEWQSRRSPRDPLDLQGRWMLVLARLPLEEAQQTAAAWLADAGWREPRYGPAVARTLGQRDAVDPLLGSLLRQEEVPLALRVQLAADRAASSEEAREWIRRNAARIDGLPGVRLVRALGEIGSPQDRALLGEIAGDPERPGMLRAEAIRALAQVAGGESLLLRFLREPPADFETVDALIETAVRSREVALREAARAGVAAGFGRGADQAEQREAFWRALWRAQARAPRAEEAAALEDQAEQVLAGLPPEDPSSPWPDPRAMRGTYEFAGLIEVVRALAACAPPAAQRPPSTLDGVAVSRTGLAVWAEVCLEDAPQAAVAVAGRLAADPRVLRGNRLRALGLAARAARRAEANTAEIAALERIFSLLKEDLDEADLVDLGYGLGLPSPRGWLLPLDEIGQRLLLAEARPLPSGRASVLSPLLEGGCRLEVLLDAAALLAEAESWSACLRFARHAADFEPRSPRARWLQGQALEALELFADARHAYREAVRLGPADPASASLAAARLRVLETR